MRIVWLSHILPFPPKGGVVQRSYNLIREVARNHEVFLFALNQKAWLPDSDSIQEAKDEFLTFCSSVLVFEIPCEKSKMGWRKLVVRSLFSTNPYTVNWTKSLEMKHALDLFLRANHVDLIHCDTVGLAEYILDVPKVRKALNHHNIESHMILRRAAHERNWFKWLYLYLEGVKLKRYEARCSPLFDVNLTVSELDKERLHAGVPNILKTDVIPNGVDVSYFAPDSTNITHGNIIFTARMNAYTNEDAALWLLNDIYPLLKTYVPDATLTLAGRNPTERMVSLAAGDKSISITGYVDDIRPFMQQAHVYICPMRLGGGTKLKVLDAMAMGKAIVCTTVAAEGLEINHGEHAIIADDAESFVRGIILLFEDDALRTRIQANARRFVTEKYSWEGIGRELDRVFRSAADLQGL